MFYKRIFKRSWWLPIKITFTIIGIFILFLVPTFIIITSTYNNKVCGHVVSKGKNNGDSYWIFIKTYTGVYIKFDVDYEKYNRSVVGREDCF